MTRRSRFLLPVVALVAGAIAVGAAQYFGGDDNTTTSPTPRPGIVVSAIDLTSAPHVPASRMRALEKDIDGVLRVLYTTAFVHRDTVDGATPDPSTSPVNPLRPLMTKAAFTELAASPDVFDPNGFTITDGRLSYKGVVTFQGIAIGALLKVDLIAHAVPIGEASPVAKVHQFGSIELKRSHDEWYVSGFDLKLTSDPVPTPSPTP